MIKHTWVAVMPALIPSPILYGNHSPTPKGLPRLRRDKVLIL